MISHVRLLQMKLFRTFMHKCLCMECAFVSLGKHRGVEWLDCVTGVTFYENAKLFSEVVVAFYTPISSV